MAEQAAASHRSESVHRFLGGGKVADIILWRNKPVSTALFGVSTLTWMAVELVGFHLITIVTSALLVCFSVFFVWNCLNALQLIPFDNLPPVPELSVPEESIIQASLYARDSINYVILILRRISIAKSVVWHLKIFFWSRLIQFVGEHVSLYTVMLLLFTVPVSCETMLIQYERHGDVIELYAYKAASTIRRGWWKRNE